MALITLLKFHPQSASKVYNPANSSSGTSASDMVQTAGEMV
jgi:hypothetical protein